MLNSNALEWLDLVLRWFHVMAGISWIGSSLYFMWLDRIFADRARAARGEHGEPWLVDLAGSLFAATLDPGADGRPRMNSWFWRESVFTWVSGILLLAAMAWLPGKAILAYANGDSIGAMLGGPVLAGFLVLSWLCYDFVWSAWGSRHFALAGTVSCTLFVATAWSLSRLFSGRTAFILAGAALGTIMAANLWFRILPALKGMAAARAAGRPADLDALAKARMRAAHNGYLIFPTVVLMLGNHFPQLYSHDLNWIALSLVAIAFVGVRHRVVGGGKGAWALYAAVGALAVAVYVVAG